MTPISPAAAREDLIAMIHHRDDLVSDLKSEVTIQRERASSWFDECAKQAGKAMSLSAQLDDERTKVAAAVDLARAATVCIDRLDRMCRGEKIADIDACNEAYRMAINVFKVVALASVEGT